MSGKGPVLGNDPFERGAADRSDRSAAEAPDKGERKEQEAPAEAEGAPKQRSEESPKKTARKRATKKPPRKKTSKKTAKKKAAKTAPRKPAESKPAESKPAESTPAEPTPAEPTPAEPTPAEPTPAEPTPAEPTPAEPTPAEPPVSRQGIPSWIRTAAATAAVDDEAPPRRSRGPVTRAMEALADAAEAPDMLTKAVQAAGMGGAAILEVGEEIAGGLERALTRVLGPVRGAELAAHLADLAAVVQSALPRTGGRPAGPRPPAYDAFGLDPEFEARLQPVLQTFFERWFRTETSGLEHVPADGRAVLVANHAGALPWDALMVKTAVALRHPSSRRVRPLIEDAVFHSPFLGPFMTRLGAVRACPENAERLLAQEALVGVFPEGVKGLGKLFRNRYQLQRFGRGGFVKLCLRTGTPIVPVAVIGSEEVHPVLFRLGFLGRSLGLPGIPVTPTFPLLGPLGLLPLPSHWSIDFGEPIDLSHYGPEAASDRVLVGRLSEQVRGRIQKMVDARVRTRRGVFF